MKVINLLLLMICIIVISGCDFFEDTKKLKEDLAYYKSEYEKTKKEMNRTSEAYKRMWE